MNKKNPLTAEKILQDRARVLALQNVSRETIARLDTFVATLLAWQAKTNLIAPSTISEIWTRHIADSLQLLKLAPDAKIWVDLGSGGGFPGLVIACALGAPSAAVHLIESNAKKAAFLRESARLTGAPAVIHAQRIEDFLKQSQAVFKQHQAESGFPQVVTARALAPLPKLLEYVSPFVEKGAKALLLKGQDVGDELTEASKYWRIEAELVQSQTDAGGRIVVVTDLQRLS